jgi:hypothetical protein
MHCCSAKNSGTAESELLESGSELRHEHNQTFSAVPKLNAKVETRARPAGM